MCTILFKKLLLFFLLQFAQWTLKIIFKNGMKLRPELVTTMQSCNDDKSLWLTAIWTNYGQIMDRIQRVPIRPLVGVIHFCLSTLPVLAVNNISFRKWCKKKGSFKGLLSVQYMIELPLLLISCPASIWQSAEQCDLTQSLQKVTWDIQITLL